MNTYKASLLHLKSYKSLKEYVAGILQGYDLSNPEWAALGYIYEHPVNIKANDLALLLEVEPPFITVLIEKLIIKGLVLKSASLDDQRVKLITLTRKGRELVQEVEGVLVLKLKKVLQGITSEEIDIYMKVMKTIITNTRQSIQ